MDFCRGEKLLRQGLPRLGCSFYSSLFNPHSEPARKSPLHGRGLDSLSSDSIHMTDRRWRGPDGTLSLLSNPRPHSPLKSPLFPGSDRLSQITLRAASATVDGGWCVEVSVPEG